MANEKEKFDATKYKNDFQKEKYDTEGYYRYLLFNDTSLEAFRSQKKIIEEKLQMCKEHVVRGKYYHTYVNYMIQKI